MAGGNERPVRIRLDLGCGTAKTPGFIGADRLPLPGVDVIFDMDRPLPFATDSVDLVLMSHSLEHARDVMATLREVYRVCRHGAQVCVVAPYYNQGLNLANPYHLQAFNEHSPRFWTDSPRTDVEPEEYYHPHAPEWGLSRSDHSDPGIDFRCLKMEFFYFPEYRNLPLAEQRAARKKHQDVCDQVMYHLMVVKRSSVEGEMTEATREMPLFEPPYVTVRKAVERADRLTAELAAAGEKSRVLEVALGAAKQATEQAELALDLARRDLHDREAELAELSRKATALAREIDLFRGRRFTRWLDRLDRTDMRGEIGPPFRQLLDDGLLFQDLRGFRLHPGPNLQHLPFAAYPLPSPPSGLRGFLLAPLLDLPQSGGVIGVEVVSPGGRIVAQSVAPLSDVSDAAPVRIDVPALGDLGPGISWLRVFVREARAPVRVLEWHRYDLGGLGRERRRAFCGFILTG